MAEFDTPGHESHEHPPFDAALFERMMREVADAKVIDNFFLIPIGGNQPRFVLAQVDEDGTINTLGYIPFNFMLDVGLGFIQAVKNAMKLGMDAFSDDPPPGDGDEPRPLAGGLFKVI